MLVSALLLLIIGLVAGLLAGLLGIGGGLVIVPALTVMLGMAGVPTDSAVAIAVATSLATMLLTSASSVWFHFRRGAVDWPTVARLGAGVACGAVAGAVLATIIPGQHLACVFALIAAVIGLRMLFARRATPASRRPRPRLWWLLA